MQRVRSFNPIFDMNSGSDTMESMNEAYEKLWTMIRECRFAMLTTTDESSELRGRPMTTLQKDFDGRIWFIAPTSSEPVRDIESNPNVSLAYSDTPDADFVSITGKASIEFDIEQKQKLWSPMVAAWFPQGPESNDVALIRVDANRADYWDSKSNRLVQLFSMAKALATGEKPKMGEHGSLRL
jgi:general stress protein 26